MKSLAVAATMILALTASAQAGQGAARACLVEVLYSEELPIGPMFQHTVKVAILVTPPGASPFETTVLKVIPWQVPPPRRGQRVRVSCDSAVLDSSFRLF
jgi:hypothetical protein